MLTRAHAQITNPPYLAGMPSVEKVESEIHGSDPTDTLARQVAIFNVLLSLIERMGLAPGRRYGSATPDECKYLNLYRTAAYELTQSYAKSHTAAEVKAFEQLHGHYELDSALSKKIITTGRSLAATG